MENFWNFASLTTKFKVPETYIYLFRDLGVGYFRKVRRRAYLEGSENLDLYLKIKLMKIGTPCKALFRGKIKNSMNVSTLFRFCNIKKLR